MFNTRILVPETAMAGEAVEVRVMIMHPMDTGFSFTTQGERIPVDIITDFTCTYLDEEVLHIRLAPGLSANPLFSFRLRAERTGTVAFKWVDQHGAVTAEEATLTVA